MEQVLSDLLEGQVSKFLEVEAENPELIRVERGKLLDPGFLRKENEEFKKSLDNIEYVNLEE